MSDVRELLTADEREFVTQAAARPRCFGADSVGLLALALRLGLNAVTDEREREVIAYALADVLGAPTPGLRQLTADRLLAPGDGDVA